MNRCWRRFLLTSELINLFLLPWKWHRNITNYYTKTFGAIVKSLFFCLYIFDVWIWMCFFIALPTSDSWATYAHWWSRKNVMYIQNLKSITSNSTVCFWNRCILWKSFLSPMRVKQHVQQSHFALGRNAISSPKWPKQFLRLRSKMPSINSLRQQNADTTDSLFFQFIWTINRITRTSNCWIIDFINETVQMNCDLYAFACKLLLRLPPARAAFCCCWVINILLCFPALQPRYVR